MYTPLPRNLAPRTIRQTNASSPSELTAVTPARSTMSSRSSLSPGVRWQIFSSSLVHGATSLPSKTTRRLIPLSWTEIFNTPVYTQPHRQTVESVTVVVSQRWSRLDVGSRKCLSTIPRAISIREEDWTWLSVSAEAVEAAFSGVVVRINSKPLHPGDQS